MEEWEDVKKELLKNEEVAQEYKKLELRYLLISELIKIRLKKGLSQKELAEKIGTKQSAIARVESGNANPSIEFLEKMTKAMDSRLMIHIK
ncbi:MAG: helix-turn-helix transcriptional regulator [Patescibacteria group bacterium]|nr:helix-turn-helix transcriptional regulator [Patescibacteria group bacterium]